MVVTLLWLLFFKKDFLFFFFCVPSNVVKINVILHLFYKQDVLPPQMITNIKSCFAKKQKIVSLPVKQQIFDSCYGPCQALPKFSYAIRNNYNTLQKTYTISSQEFLKFRNDLCQSPQRPCLPSLLLSFCNFLQISDVNRNKSLIGSFFFF